jgi:hypothetical protein
MNKEQAIKTIVNTIWKHGERLTCLTPSDIFGHSEYNDASDFLIDECNVTHIDLSWEEKGKKVRAKLYNAEDLGAAIITEENLVEEIIVEV